MITLKLYALRLRFLGLRNSLRAILYSLNRDWQEWRHALHRHKEASLGPGEFQQAGINSAGGRFIFSNAALEVQFLAADLVRLTWTPGALPIPYAIATQDWPEVEVHIQEVAAGWSLTSDALKITLDLEGGLRFTDPQNQTLRKDAPPIRQGEAWRHRAHLSLVARVYGLGERAAGLNLRGGRYRLWNTDPGGSYGPGKDPLYLTIPVYLAVDPPSSHLVFYENSFDGDIVLDEFAEAHFRRGALRYYFIPGPPSRALKRYGQLTGRPPLAPRWALGFHQSRWGYQTADEIREILNGFVSNELGLNAIHLDIDHMDGYRLFTIDENRFPDMGRLARDLAVQDVHLVSILDCGVKVDRHYPLFRKGLERSIFLKNPAGIPQQGLVWPGWSLYPDFSDPDGRAWWGEQYKGLLDRGIDGFWHDMNEPTSFAAWGDLTLPGPTRHSMEGRGGDHREAHNLYGLLMARAGYEGLQAIDQERRPWLLTRSGWAGIQRYAWNWTGDTESTWEALRMTIPTVLGLGLSGVPFTGPDVGGFSGAPTAELFTRWFQLAAFMPFFRNHAAMGTPPREPWSFGQPYLDILREYLNQRQRLMPYLYTLAWESHQTCYPMARPLFWPDATDPELLEVEDAFLLGDSLLVAPILQEGVDSRTIILPSGAWYQIWDDLLLEGPGEYIVPGPLERVPVLARAGSVIPMESGHDLTLHIYPPVHGTSSGWLYSDSGDGYGEWRLDRFLMHRQGWNLEVRWEQEGDFLFPYQGITIQLHNFPATVAVVDGIETPVNDSRLPVGYFSVIRFDIPE